jgi:hypothetical protein
VAGNGQSGAISAQSGAATGGASGAVGAGANRYPCSNVSGTSNGSFVQCSGFKHREQEMTCPTRPPRAEAISHQVAGECNYDADCTDKPYGWCSNYSQLGNSYCAYGCAKDSECASGQICECGDPVGRCVPADCSSDADCQSGFLCRSFDSSGGCALTAYSCQAPADACGADAECGTGSCRLDLETRSFQCFPLSCFIGRPFLVEGVARLAPIAARADWLEPAFHPQLTDLAPSLRVQLAEQWTRIAMMEHASVAAFARFTLQLMSHGAPAWLIERATAALLDETKHAKACFSIASGYSGAPVGPGPLAVERSLDESSLRAVVLNTIREGCVGETVAAIEAHEAAQHAFDPTLRELLLVIAEDETRHAQLAYSFVQWALELGDPELARAVRREFAALAAETPARGAPVDSDDALLRHGVVPEALRLSIRSQAISEVIVPCSHSLFSTRVPAAGLANAAL